MKDNKELIDFNSGVILRALADRIDTIAGRLYVYDNISIDLSINDLLQLRDELCLWGAEHDAA